MKWNKSQAAKFYYVKPLKLLSDFMDFEQNDQKNDMK